MGRHAAARTDPGLSRRQDIARNLGLAEDDREPGKFAGRCPACGKDAYSIKHPDRARYLHIWTCPACQHTHGRNAEPGILRAAMLHRGIHPGWLGGYALDTKAADPQAAAELRETVDLILAWPQLKPSKIRVLLAAGRGDKVPEDFGGFVKFALAIGIGRRQAYEIAPEFCRSSSVPHPGGGSADA